MIKESFGNIIIYYITIKDRLTLDGLAKTISKSLHLKYPDLICRSLIHASIVKNTSLL